VSKVAEQLLLKDNICFVPALHGRVEFAVALRRAWEIFDPQAVAVELPRSLSGAVKEGLARLPHLSVVHYREGDEVVYLLIEPTDAAIEALRLAAERGLPGHLIDAEPEGYPASDEAWPDSYAVSRLSLAAFGRPFIDDPPPASPSDRLREETMAHRLQELQAQYRRILFVCGLGHAGRVWRLLDEPQPLPLGRGRPKEAQAANLAPESIPEVTSEAPFLIKAFEDWRSGERPGEPDRLLVEEELLGLAACAAKKQTGEEIRLWQIKTLRRFKRNWAVLSGRLTPDFYQLVVSARGVGGDEYAYQVWEKGVAYPWTELNPAWEVLRLRAEDLRLNQKRISFHRPLRRQRRRLMPVPERPRLQEAYPGQWAETWSHGKGICSYPPEDVIIEDFGREAARKSLLRLAQENRVVEPFTVSLLDGIDFRETLRRRPTEDKLYVFEQRASASQVGAVVIVFDEDEGVEERFDWKLTWLGEHTDESDMAFYATPPGEDLAGPGVSRCIYGGLVMTYPPRRMLDIWTDPYFDQARSKSERLLLAAADYSLERVVAYLARRPPSHRARSLAQRMGRQVAYLPLGALPPATLNKIRVFHVLASHEVRTWAGEYIKDPGGIKSRKIES